MSVTTRSPDALALAERLIIQNDVSKLSVQERVAFYRARCQWYGIDWRLAPFDYIVTKAGLKLYLNAVGADLLRKHMRISIVESHWEFIQNLCVATVVGETPDGRRDREIGAVSTRNVPPDEIPNLPMKALTKAKRRLTISMGGMGAEDDSSVEPPETITASVIHEEETAEAEEQGANTAQDGQPQPQTPAVFPHSRLTRDQQESMYNAAVERNVGRVMPVDDEQEPATQTWGQVIEALINAWHDLRQRQGAAGGAPQAMPLFGPLRDGRVSPGRVYRAMLELPTVMPTGDEEGEG